LLSVQPRLLLLPELVSEGIVGLIKIEPQFILRRFRSLDDQSVCENSRSTADYEAGMQR
jgi:predicted transcriptional regulator